jgi:hypothetical protein
MSIGMSARIAMMRRRMWRETHLKLKLDQGRIWRTEVETSDVDGVECEDGHNADQDEEEQASQADDGSRQNVEE